jgi:hypothetical protein
MFNLRYERELMQRKSAKQAIERKLQNLNANLNLNKDMGRSTSYKFL